MPVEESISLEETNKIRIKLGLKPLTDDSTPANDKDKEAEENYKKQREQEAKEKEKKAVQDRIAKVKNRQELNAKLKGKTLGDADPEVEDTKKWIKRSKRKEKELAKKLQEELSLDREVQEEYTEKDLVGLKVSHDFEGMEDGEEHILTLKDSRILEGEEDELQNVEIAEHEKTKKNQEMKIKRREYTGYDDDEFAPGNEGLKRSLLSKYDEFLEGPKEMGFRLGSSSTTTRTQREEQEQAAKSVNKMLLSIDYDKNIEMTDYLKEGDIGFKKPKTKKKRSSRKTAEVTDVTEDDDMQVDETSIVPRQRNLDANFVDDDELQAALARSRRAKTKKPKKLSPEALARQIAEERERSATNDDNVIKIEDDAEEGGLVFDDTSEFVRAITYNPVAVKQEQQAEPRLSHARSRQSSVTLVNSVKEEDGMMVDDVPVDEVEAGEVVIKEEEDEDEDMLDAIGAALEEQERIEKAAAAGDITVGTASEQNFSSGMAATLNILRTQGILAKPDANQSEREHVQLQRDVWLAEYRRLQAQRDLDKAKTRGGNRDQATREYENRLRDQQEARQTLEAFKHYKPDVNIVYHDEFGRELTPKEAWKALSHKFHGKGSGRMKTEKRLKKIADERKKEAMASGDTPLSMNQAFQARQEKTGQAHFVLSVGNRGAVPQASEFFDPQPLSKGKTEKKNKKKGGPKDAIPQLDGGGFITLSATQSYNDSPGPASGAASTSNGSPAPRPGFSRIGSNMAEVDSGAGTPGPMSSGTKFVLGLNKRKAGEEPAGTPPPKRR